MYTSANKARQSQAVKKLPVNSNKSHNHSLATTTYSKIKDMENQIKAPPLISKRNLSKSKFTVSRASKSSKQLPLSSAPLSGKVISIAKRENRIPDAFRKSNIHLSAASKINSINKIMPTENSSLKKRILRRRNKSPASEKIKTEVLTNNPRETSEISVQTNEDEILNHLLIVGDFKIITPSKSVTNEIDKLQKEKVREKLLMSKRKFEEHSQKEEQHLDDLKEFLDKSFITRKLPKLCDNILEEDRKLIVSMDELLQRERPKTDSITDIKSRIKRKERELLSLFDRFQKKSELLAK